ncbi:MAG: tRNA 4-thiouridine(8) synthase ThiI, partial [Candidatus Tectomicrobia bacterium]|nr:tRNA 4-thiouridine(8) synthase ThiI [Candidatus Tectomicrobia bacterium]
MRLATPGKEGSRCVLLHYHEIGLKGKNRPLFISRLARRVALASEHLGAGPVRKLPGRLILELPEGAPWPQVREALARVFGLANFSCALRLPLDLEAAAEAALAQLAPLPVTTFRVRTRKAFDTVPISSREWDSAIGARVQARRRLPVSLTHPGTTVHIEALPAEALLYVGKVPGPGGLPVGMSGRVAALLSGGIDSPVAAWRMLKRGCEVVFVHFHGAPYLSRASADKARDLARLLDLWQQGSRLYLVPFGDLQKEIVLSAPSEARVVLYRRFMARIAERIARLEGARALVTGESLGQVASQTLTNLAAIEEAVEMPILRPLIGMDKEEIVAQAQALGTFETSIEPDQDCCTLFVPKHPAIRSQPAHLRKLEENLAVDEMIARALAETEVLDIRRDGTVEVMGFEKAHPGV